MSIIIEDNLGNQFEYDNAPAIIHDHLGNQYDVNTYIQPILQKVFLPDSKLIKCMPQPNDTSIIIPDGIIEISPFAFENCAVVSSIYIPQSVSKIGAYAFNNCKSLSNVVLRGKATEIDDTAFTGCAELSNEQGLVIVEGILFDCFSISHAIEIPPNVHTIGAKAFNRCKNLLSITIPDCVEKISNGAFSGCAGLADKDGFIIVNEVLYDCISKKNNIEIPNGVKHIGVRAFTNCNELLSIAFPGSIDEINMPNLFDYTKLESIVFAEGIRKIGRRSFAHCPNLRSVTLPKSVVCIERGAFLHCPNLTIHAPTNSLGIQYAKDNSIRFIEES